MKRILFILTVVLFLIPGNRAWSQTDKLQGSVVSMPDRAAEVIEIEKIVLEDGTEEVQEVLPASAYEPLSLDERYLSIQVDVQQRIDAILEEIQGLADGNAEGELQKQIEQIKMDAEIERLTFLKEDAEGRGDHDLADELTHEIKHLGRIDEPPIGYQEKQQSPTYPLN